MLKNIIQQQKAEKERLETQVYVDREILSEAASKLSSPLIKVVVGPRRAGKSVLAMLMLKGKKFGYLNCDDDEIAKLEHYDPLIEELIAEEGEMKFIFFDEIQNLDNWELFISKLHRRGYNLVLSGSNSRLLSRELATALTGRYAQIDVMPFSFREFLRARLFSFSEKDLNIPDRKGQMLNHLSAWLKEGGYPEPTTHNFSARDYLKTLFEAVLFKDVVKRYKIRTPGDIYNLALYLMSNACSEYTFNSLTAALKLRSVKTVQKYVGFLEGTCLFYSLNRFSPKLNVQMRVPRKVYLVDNGFFQSSSFALSENWNKLMENAVFTELVRQGRRPNLDIFYYRTRRDLEVDFFIRDGIAPKKLIQVCHDIGEQKTFERETKALVEAAKETGCKELAIITHDQSGDEKLGEHTIQFVPLWRFLLGI